MRFRCSLARANCASVRTPPCPARGLASGHVCLGRSTRRAALSFALPVLTYMSMLRSGSHSALPATWLGLRPVGSWPAYSGLGPRYSDDGHGASPTTHQVRSPYIRSHSSLPATSLGHRPRLPRADPRTLSPTRYSDHGTRTTATEPYRRRTSTVVIAATRPAKARAARSSTASKPQHRAMSSTASTSNAEPCAMSKNRRRDAEPAR